MTAMDSDLKSVTRGSEPDSRCIVKEYLDEEMVSTNAELSLP